MIELSMDWRSVALRGAAAVAFGVLTLVWPGLTITVLVLLFGIYALIDGVVHLMAAFGGSREREGRGVLIFEGVAGVIAGIIAIVWPGITALALLYVIAAWAIITGVIRIMAALQLRREIPNEWLLVAIGALSVVFGIILVVAPVAGALAITWLIGFYALLFGLMLLGLAWQLRKTHGRIEVRAGPLGHGQATA
jgi:uncharacterized membrane protein HdeD (DUF308 family)